jgi:pimeloyl-ACP methyl ester carboxylesterase
MKIFIQCLVIICAIACLQGCKGSPFAEVKKAKVGDIELAYYQRGSGEPLIMIMGFRGTMAIWDPSLLEILEKKYTLTLFDNRGVGFSTDNDKNELTVAQMAEDTAGLIMALGYPKAHILGWSMGSRIAMELALNHPELVESLILCSPNPGGEHQAKRPSDAYKTLMGKNLSEEEGLSLIFPDTPEGHEASVSFVARLSEAVITGTVPKDLEVTPKAVERQVQALTLWDKNNHMYEDLKKIKAPTLVAGGLSDVLDSPENVKIVANQIPNAWMALFPGAGHDFLSQDYQHFGNLVLLFLESTK